MPAPLDSGEETASTAGVSSKAPHLPTNFNAMSLLEAEYDSDRDMARQS